MLKEPFREPYKIDSQFGEKRDYGYHSGSDWNGTGGGNTDCGYKLYPIKNAEIVHTSEADVSYGKIVVCRITGTFGERWIRYCHCREILVTGGIVTPETPIATLGTTGNSTACHLHWDVIKKPLPNWRSYAKTKEYLNEYFEDPVAFFNKYKNVPDENNSMDIPKYFSDLLNEYQLDLTNEGQMREFMGKGRMYTDHITQKENQIISLTEQNADLNETISTLTQETQRLRGKLEEAEEKINTTRVKLDKADGQVRDLAFKNEAMAAKIDKLAGDMDTLQDKYDDLKIDYKALEGKKTTDMGIIEFILAKLRGGGKK